MRTFIAIEIDHAIRDKIGEIQHRLAFLNSKISLVPPQNMHLTLKFLGELGEEEVALLKEGLARYLKGTHKFSLHFSGSGVFPSEQRVRVVWVGIDKGKRELTSLSQTIEPLFTEIGIEVDKKPFSPHITIGRVKVLKDREKLLKVIKEMGTIAYGTQVANKVVFKKSILGKSGAVYETLAEFPLI
ncbi:RNA 2',3'-cyclic phosphodiesterase [Candidatus Auribacterota bacterium]